MIAVGFQRVTKNRPCRICGKPTYCGFRDMKVYQMRANPLSLDLSGSSSEPACEDCLDEDQVALLLLHSYRAASSIALITISLFACVTFSWYLAIRCGLVSSVSNSASGKSSGLIISLESRNGGNIHVHPEIPFITIRPTSKRPISQSVALAPLEIRDAVFQELIRISPASTMEELVAGPSGLLSRGLLRKTSPVTEHYLEQNRTAQSSPGS